MIERRLGAGGMGEVYAGFDEVLRRPVAVKTLHAATRLNDHAKARFLREARILSRLDHPGICRIYDLVEEADNDFLILELINGRTVRELASDHPGQTTILSLTHAVADALAAAHGESVVHRDLKPDNVMVTADGQVKILDFGIARSADARVVVQRQHGRGDPGPIPAVLAVDAAAGHAAPGCDLPTTDETVVMPAATPPASGTGPPTEATVAGTVLGTVRYMSPEQAAGGAIGPASDMYSLGIMLHELLTGSSPYGGADGITLLLKVYRAETLPLTGLDPELAELIAELESIDPAARPSAAATRDRLLAILTRPERERQRRWRLLAVATVATAVLVGAGVAAHARLEAGRRAALAQRFAAAAKDLEWQLRAEYLCPAHDLRPATERARREIAGISAAMAELGRGAAGPGHYALGAAHLALAEHDQARAHLEQAWTSGYDGPEVGYALGLTLGELYLRELQRASRSTDPDERRQRLEAARSALRDRARELLAAARDAVAVDSRYVEGLIALYEDRYDDALAAAASDDHAGAAWFYELDILRAAVHESLAAQAGLGRNDVVGTIAELGRAVDCLRRAGNVARSDPRVQLALCRVETSRFGNLVRSRAPEALDEAFAGASAACAEVSVLDPDQGEGYAFRARLLADLGAFRSARGEDPSEAFRTAVELAERAVSLAPGNPWTLGLRGWCNYQEGFHLMQSGGDARKAFDRAVADFAAASARPETTGPFALNHADSLFGRAAAEMALGGDPNPFLDCGIAVVRERLARSPGSSSLNTVLGNLCCLLGRTRAGRGLAAEAAYRESIEGYSTAAVGATNPEVFRNLALVQTDLGDYLLSRGEDPRPVYQEAVASAERAIGLNPTYGLPQLVRGMAFEGLARYAARTGGDPGSAAGEALRSCAEAARLRPGLSEAWLRAAQITLFEAAAAVRERRDPRPLVASTRGSLRQARAVDPTSLDADLIQVRLDTLLARWRAARGESPERSLATALALLDRACADSDRSECQLVRAELQIERAAWALRHGGSAAQLIEAGLAATARVLAVNANLAEAHALRAQLLSLQATAAPDSTTAAAAQAALARALGLNPLLAGELTDLSTAVARQPPQVP